jgi:flagellar biosynthesis/type III secretory pathway protein FliH
MVGGHPATAGGLLRIAARYALVVLPLVLLVAGQVWGRRWQYDASEIEAQIAQERAEQRRLRARIAARLAPDELRAKAEELGLEPAESGPFLLADSRSRRGEEP